MLRCLGCSGANSKLSGFKIVCKFFFRILFSYGQFFRFSFESVFHGSFFYHVGFRRNFEWFFCRIFCLFRNFWEWKFKMSVFYWKQNEGKSNFYKFFHSDSQIFDAPTKCEKFRKRSKILQDSWKIFVSVLSKYIVSGFQLQGFWTIEFLQNQRIFLKVLKNYRIQTDFSFSIWGSSLVGFTVSVDVLVVILQEMSFLSQHFKKLVKMLIGQNGNCGVWNGEPLRFQN